MIITLADRTEHYVNAERGEKLKAVLLDPNSPDYVQINSVLVKKSYIVKLQDGGQPPAITEKDRLLTVPTVKIKPADPKKIARIKDLLRRKDYASLKKQNQDDTTRS